MGPVLPSSWTVELDARLCEARAKIAALEAENERLKAQLKNAHDAFCMYLSASTRGAAAVWSRELG